MKCSNLTRRSVYHISYYLRIYSEIYLCIMENKKTNRPADNHPAIQNLRRFYSIEANDDGKVSTFALKMGVNERQMGAHLRGEHEPRERTVRKWADYFGIEYTDMLTADFEYIPCPLKKLSKPKKSGRHFTKREYRELYGTMEDEVSQFVSESDIGMEYGFKILEIIALYKP